MASNKVYKFRSINDLNQFMNGGITGGDVSKGVSGLVGNKLKFTSPSAQEVTFVATSDPNNPYLLHLADIKAQIEAVIPAVRVFSMDGRIAFIEVAPTSGVALGAASSLDCRTVLGFDQGHNTVGKVFAPPSGTFAAPCWTWADSTGENFHILYTWE